MRKQLFYIFHTNKYIFKTYLNQFIIDEDAENEVIKVAKLIKTPLSSNRIFRLIKKGGKLVQADQSTKSLFEIIEEANQLAKSVQKQDFQVHFIVGAATDSIPILSSVFLLYIALISPGHSTLLLCNLVSRFKDELDRVPLVNRRLKNSGLNDVTIGDDIDSLIGKFTYQNLLRNYDILYSHQTKKMLYFKLLGPSYMKKYLEYPNTSDKPEVVFEIYECQRKFFAYRQNAKSLLGRFQTFFIIVRMVILDLIELIWRPRLDTDFFPIISNKFDSMLKNFFDAVFNYSNFIVFWLMFMYWNDIDFLDLFCKTESFFVYFLIYCSLILFLSFTYPFLFLAITWPLDFLITTQK